MHAPESESTPSASARHTHGRSRHARTNASLTSSSGGSSRDAPFSSDRLLRRTSVPNEASRIFQATGFDPFGTEPDTLFRSLTVKEVEAYERAVRSTAFGKQEELRGLVGQRYEDLLGTANTIIDMAGSSTQLSQRLSELSIGITSAAGAEETSDASKKASRRKSFLPTPQKLDGSHLEASSLHQEAIYVLGASLRLVMDAPEYIWKSIEKGKTLQAAWAFMLARATWRDLVEVAPHASPMSASAMGGEEGVSSASEAVSLLKVNVKKAFPFIEKQWQTMLPMRKQIVHRAVALLSDVDIESMAVADQLAALILIDGTKPDQALQLLLSQRMTAMRRLLHQRQASLHRADVRQEETSEPNEVATGASHGRATQSSQTIAQLVTLLARTLQHAVQIFMLPPRSDPTPSSRPLLLHMLTTITDATNFPSGTTAAVSPTSERSFLFPQSASKEDSHNARQSAAAARALRRRSSHGLPVANHTEDVASQMTQDHAQPEHGAASRVSTLSVIRALPSASIILRLLPPSVWKFAPSLDLESQDMQAHGHVLAELSSWSTKAREEIFGSPGNSTVDRLPSLLSGVSDLAELALIRRSLRVALHRAQRIVSRKLAGSDDSADERRKKALAGVQSELQQVEKAIDAMLQERLLHLMEQKLKHAVQQVLSETQQFVSTLQSGSGSLGGTEDLLVDAPLGALFDQIEAEAGSTTGRGGSSVVGEPASATKASRTFAAALQDHVRGRSRQVDRLTSLYEGPLTALSDELQLYQIELQADERFADVSRFIGTRFESSLASSRAEVEKGLMELLKQAQPTPETVSKSTSRRTGLSMSTLLVMRLISVLAAADPSKGDGSASQHRASVQSALEQFWAPNVERHISATLRAGQPSQAIESSVSSAMLSAMALLSESIVQLGPALAGPELAAQVRAILESVAGWNTTAAHDVEALRALLACDAAGLSKHIAADASLHRIRLALSPLLLALATSAPSEAKLSSRRPTTEMVLSRAEPASAAGHAQPILSVSRKKVERFSPLPVR